jgi:hypothetical protein
MNLTQYAQDVILNLFRKGMYVALLAESPENAADIIEVRARGYKRQALVLGAPTNGVCDNPQEIKFGVAPAHWGKVVSIGVYDAPIAGNLWLLSKMERPQTVEEGSPFKIPVGELTISLF